MEVSKEKIALRIKELENLLHEQPNNKQFLKEIEKLRLKYAKVQQKK